MLGFGDEPGPDAAEHTQRLAEEERRLPLVVEHEGGTRPGVVIRCQKANNASSRPSCHRRRFFVFGFERPAGDRLRPPELTPPSPAVAARSPSAPRRAAPPRSPCAARRTRRGAHLGHVARAFEVDVELADRVRAGPARQHRPRVAHRNRFFEVVRDEHHRFASSQPTTRAPRFPSTGASECRAPRRAHPSR